MLETFASEHAIEWFTKAAHNGFINTNGAFRSSVDFNDWAVQICHALNNIYLGNLFLINDLVLSDNLLAQDL